MIRYLRIFWRSLQLSTMKFLAYPAHFLIGLVTTTAYGLINFSFLYLVFEAGNVEQIVGFTRYEVYFVFAITQLIYVLTMMFFNESASMFRRYIHQGWLDILMTKPINTVFYSTFERVYYFTGLSILIYVSLIFVYTLPRLEIVWSLLAVVKLIFIVSVGWCLYAILIWMSSLIWLYWSQFKILRILVSNSFEFNRNPPDVYPAGLRWFLSIIFPVLLIGNQTYYWLNGEYGWPMMLRDLGVLIIFVMIYILMWMGGLRRYNSAN